MTEPRSASQQPIDTRGRALRDLRVSVTDRCNLRCRYCMPREIFGPGFTFLPRNELLHFEEIARVVGAFARAGVKKVRLTGGEPLLRVDLPDLVAMVAAVPGIDDIALTTNGSLLARHADRLHAAGLTRITVSLDTLDDGVLCFHAGTRRADDGIAGAREGDFIAVGEPCGIAIVDRRAVGNAQRAHIAQRCVFEGP